MARTLVARQVKQVNRNRNLLKIFILLILGATALVLVSCGREAPTYAPGTIVVTSTPEGADILLDGVDTGLDTPATLADLAVGLYMVSVHLDEWETDPEFMSFEVAPLEVLEADFTLSQTGIRVLGPEGARILVDGTDTGKIAPAFVSVEPGTVKLSVELDTYHVSPSFIDVAVIDGDIVEMAEDEFHTRSQRTVVLEGFSNVSCPPCPELTANLLAMSAKPEFSPDRVLFIEFAVSWPELTDPFYLANPVENGNRYTWYQVFGAPDLYENGIQVEDALDAAAMEAGVLAALKTDPGFLIDVDADPSGATVPVGVTLSAPEPIDLGGTSLFIGLYEKVVTIDPAPGLNGQTEFHHVFRDQADSHAQPGFIDPGMPTTIVASVNRGDIDPENLVIIAFVQRDSDKVILQGGSTALESVQP